MFLILTTPHALDKMTGETVWAAEGVGDKAGYATVIFPVFALIISSIMEGYQWTALSFIGMALVARPTLLLLDEPLLGLSPMMQTLLVDAVKGLRSESRITVLLSEQFARPVLPIIDYGYVVENGMLSLTGTGVELMDNPEIKATYFRV